MIILLGLNTCDRYTTIHEEKKYIYFSTYIKMSNPTENLRQKSEKKLEV